MMAELGMDQLGKVFFIYGAIIFGFGALFGWGLAELVMWLMGT